MKRKVIDSNYFADPALEDFLRASNGNIAILCEYAGIEGYRSEDPVDGIYRSISILKRYPSQVMVLKGVRVISSQRKSKSGYLQRMIHEEQTKGFAGYCRDVILAKSGSVEHIRGIQELAKDAVTEADDALAEVGNYLSAADEQMKVFSKAELAKLKDIGNISEALFKKVATIVMELTLMHFQDVGIDVRKESLVDISHSVVFRQALCFLLRTIRWHANGEPSKNHGKIRNHIYDCGFAAYATFFDGFLSKDIEALRTYKDAVMFLQRIEKGM